MTFTVTTHLNFQGQARAALDFYKDVFGGEQTLMTYGAMGQAEIAVSPDHVIWGQVASDDGFRIMAFDVQAGRDYDAGEPPSSYRFGAPRSMMCEHVGRRWPRVRRSCKRWLRRRGRRSTACSPIVSE